MNQHQPQEAEAWITRHSIKGEGSTYEGLASEGAEKAKERAGELASLIEHTEPGSVIFFGGSTFEVRTRSTLRAYADALAQKFHGRNDIVMFDNAAIAEEAKNGYLEASRALRDKADAHPEAKIVIDLPLQLKDFSRKEWWYDKDGNVRPAVDALLKKHGKNYATAVREWFGHGGMTGGEQAMARPQEIAESYLSGMRRLEDFVGKFSGNRKIKIVIVGHSFEMDALLTYLANNGTVSPDGFEKIGGEVIDTAELAVIEPDSEGNMHLRYRGQEFVWQKSSGNEKSTS